MMNNKSDDVSIKNSNNDSISTEITGNAINNIEFDENIEFEGATLKLTNDNTKNIDNNNKLSSSSATIPTTSKENNQENMEHQQQTTENNITPGTSNSSQTLVTGTDILKPKVGSPRHFFSFRSGQFEQAIHDCLSSLLRPVNDIDIHGNWLLTEISHWDHERERILILTSKTLYIIKYDFIAMRILENNKYRLNTFDTIIKGKLTYPNSSIVPNHHDIGVRLLWNKGQPLSAITSWNPFATNIPWKTFTNHPLFGYKDEFNSPKHILDNIHKNQLNYSVSLFYDALIKLYQNDNIEGSNINYNCAFQEMDIIMENYAGIGALIHNKNNFGFFKVRGKFSF